MKAKYKDAEFNFKKFDVSSAVVETMIEKQMKWKTKQVEGLGYNNVPPPFNDNYTSPIETKEVEEPVKYEKVNDTNASTSCAGKTLVDDGHQQDTLNSSFVDSFKTDSLISSVSSTLDCDVKPVKTFVPLKTCGNVVLNGSSKNRTFEKVKPQNFVKQSICACSCVCGSSSKQNSGQGPSHNLIYLKRQTCFNCGTPGHIARNCPLLSYAPYYEQGWQNVSRGDLPKEIPQGHVHGTVTGMLPKRSKLRRPRTRRLI